MAKQTREQLGVKEHDSVIIKGIVSFARLDKLVEGVALDQENARRAQRGMIPSEKPFRSVTIEKPDVVAGKGSPLAQYYGQSVYTTKDGNSAMTFESKSPFAPKFGHLQNGVLVEIADPMKNPSPGQEIFIKLDAYAPKGFSRLGSSFTQIVYGEGEIKFYESTGNSLAGFGEALGVKVQALPQDQQVVANNDTFGEAPVQAQSAPAETNAFGAPAQPPASEGNPFGVQDSQVNQAQNAFGAPASNGQKTDNPFA